MDMISAGALCVGVCIAAQLLRDNGEIKTVMVILCVSVLTAGAASDILGIREQAEELMERAELDGEYLTVIFKGLGICYVTKLSADCCRDCGQTALASAAELLGRLGLIAAAMPLFRGVAGIVEALLA